MKRQFSLFLHLLIVLALSACGMLPAVADCFNSTKILRTGDFVRVDGAHSLVEILKADRERS